MLIEWLKESHLTWRFMFQEIPRVCLWSGPSPPFRDRIEPNRAPTSSSATSDPQDSWSFLIPQSSNLGVSEMS